MGRGFIHHALPYFLLQAAVAEQGVNGGRLATVLLVELHGIHGVARLKKFLESVGSSLVEATGFLEGQITVGLEHLSPQVGVVTASILVVSKDVLEVFL